MCVIKSICDQCLRWFVHVKGLRDLHLNVGCFVVGSDKPMACAKGVQTACCSFTNKKMQWLTWRNFDVVVVHFAFAANKKLQ